MRVPILTYQPMRIGGNDYLSSDLAALAADIELLTAAGYRIVPLRTIVDAWLALRGGDLEGKIVALTCQAGADFDFIDLPHPVAGPQRSVMRILREFRNAHPSAQAQLNVTSFVIASPDARAVLDSACMLGKGWWNDHWWPEAARGDLLHLGNLSWDFNHEALPATMRRSRRGGTFLSINTPELAEHEVAQAARFLAERAPNPGAGLFAYPYGEANSYLAREYFPSRADGLGIRAAFTTQAGFLEPGTSRWEVPRFLFGRDWSSPEGLEAILEAAQSERPWVLVRREQEANQDLPEARLQTRGDLKAFSSFVAGRVEPIPGWLHSEAALLTAHLAAAQRSLGVIGPTLEIGVYRGKYLAVLYQLSQPDERVIGVDLFIGAADTREAASVVHANIATACGGASRLRLVAADSMELTPERLLAESSMQPYRFISIDAGHTAPLVLHDLETTYPTLREGGIMALDDIYNPIVPGVVEGIARFFVQRKPALAPFAYGFNKLFVTTPGFHAKYLREAERFLEETPWLATHERTMRNRSDNRSNQFTPELFGYEILAFD
jgi:hypothetical protein